MNKIKILDCTLRDGGYINNWDFGEQVIKEIISKLSHSNIDIIECGFITDIEFNRNKSLFDSVERIREYIEPKNENVSYVGMIAQPYPDINKISNCDRKSIDGIRLTFHENEIEEAMIYGEELIKKGYMVYIQPVGTTSYSDSSLLKLIKKVNELKPYAFYLVDTLGIMYKNDLLRMFHLLDNNLEESISIGFHSHNNLQLSFSNAQELLMLHTKRNIIIDSSVFGMGRGAGNLCTELITQYINMNIEERYNTIPLLEIYDEYLSKMSNDIQWGYSMPYYIAAANKCHPNYASYLINKQTITVKSINIILKQLPLEKRDIFDKEYIENLYINHQIHFVNDSYALEKIKELINNKKVLIIAPGKSAETEMDEINSFIIENNPFIISVNFIPESYECDATFFSNQKRIKDIVKIINKGSNLTQIITTSNIKKVREGSHLVVNYSDLLVNTFSISDNAGLMLINLLNRLAIAKVYLAGFDGFSVDKSINYYSSDIVNNAEITELVKKNEVISNYLNTVSKYMGVYFVTKSVYDKNN